LLVCPDEDTFARFVQGILRPEAMSDIERHVDGCARCSDLAAEFGRLYADPAPESPRPSPSPSPSPSIDRRFAPLALALAALIHIAWVSLLSRAPVVLHGLMPPSLAAAYLRYASFWAPVGSGVALAAAFGVAGRQRWGRALAIVHAAVSLPSIVLTPLAFFVLDSLRRDRAR
jgi:hypothetical protein